MRKTRTMLATFALGATVALAGGVLWSNALAYSNVWLAPRAQLGELCHRFIGGLRRVITERSRFQADDPRFRYPAVPAVTPCAD